MATHRVLGRVRRDGRGLLCDRAVLYCEEEGDTEVVTCGKVWTAKGLDRFGHDDCGGASVNGTGTGVCG